MSDQGEPRPVIHRAFTDFGRLQRTIEDRKLMPLSAEPVCVPQAMVRLPESRPPAC